MASEARDRISSAPRLSLPQLTSVRIPNPNIFSDEYALDPLESSASSSPISPIRHSSDEPAVDIFSTPRASTENRRSLSDAPPLFNRPNSTLKRPREVQDATVRRSISTASNAESGTHRTSSTSSRFSMPRSQSPYVGASGPSHPYAMYPQVTRASSIASASTIRPAERAPIPSARPEHPYAMYPQNIVPEEDDVRPPPMSIPLGFPGMGEVYQQGTRSVAHDIADIVGADGHVEQLPPYSRYPDNGVPKDSVSPLNTAMSGQTQDRSDAPMLPQPTASPFSDHRVPSNMAAARTAGSDSDSSFKERWREKSKRRVLCGLPMWCLLVLIAVIILVGATGGAIGGIFTNRRQGDAITDAQPESTPSTGATVTVTSWIDASPLPTASGIPTIPTGAYNVPIGQTNLDSNSCIVDNALSAAWGCMGPGSIWVDVQPFGSLYQISFQSFPLNISFQYGPQPPNLDGVAQPLFPFVDKDASELGPAMFFYDLYDKLTILPAEALNNYTATKRSLSVNDIAVRSVPNGQIGKFGDQPWFCWFNQTILEFFIYPEYNTTSSTASIALSSPSSTSMPNNGASYPTNLNRPSAYSSSPPWPTQREKRHHDDGHDERYSKESTSLTNYPLWVKMEEKRKPENNIQPYCQQMRILDSGLIVPQEGVSIINITEIEPSSSSSQKRDSMDGSTTSLGSNCVCEWLVTT